MQDPYKSFEDKLYSLLNHTNPEHRGIEIQQERYKRDRKYFLSGCLKMITNSQIDHVLNQYIEEVESSDCDISGWAELVQFLKWLPLLEYELEIKQEIYFHLACIAAQQIELPVLTDEILIPKLKEFLAMFCIHEKTVWISSYGYINNKYKLTGAVKISSSKGKVSIASSEEICSFFKHSQSSIAEEVFPIAEKHSWSITNERKAQIKNNGKLAYFYSLSEFEFFSVAKDEEQKHKTSIKDFAKIMYPLWLPNSLGLSITYHCNATCSHCYNASSPLREKKVLKWSDISREINFYAQVGVDEIGISGGEPFLFFNELEEIILGLIQNEMKRIVPITNGYWGKNKQLCEEYIKRLQKINFGKNGKDQIKISLGEYHLNQNGVDLDIDYALNIAEAHYRILGVKVSIDIEQIQSDTIAKEIVIRAKERNLANIIDWKFRGTLSDSGRAKKIAAQLDQKKLNLAEFECPVKSRGAIYPDSEWVYCTGTVYPKNFLSFAYSADGIPITARLAFAQRDPRMPYWQFGNFQQYLEDYNEKIGKVKLPESIANKSTPCGVCAVLFKNVFK